MGSRKPDSDLFGSVPVAPGAKASRPRALRGVDVARVEVTAEDIAKGVERNSHSCMIAEAIKRQVPGVSHVSVDIQTIRFTDVKGDRRVACLTPPAAQHGLFMFDLGRPVKPFRFRLKSVQVTARTKTVVKRDESGQPVRRETVGRPLRDGSVPRYVTARREAVSIPSRVKEVKQAAGDGRPSRMMIVGGNLPGRHKPSANRVFGAKAYSWDDDEDPRVVAARTGRAWGVVGDATPAELPGGSAVPVDPEGGLE